MCFFLYLSLRSLSAHAAETEDGRGTAEMFPENIREIVRTPEARKRGDFLDAVFVFRQKFHGLLQTNPDQVFLRRDSDCFAEDRLDETGRISGLAGQIADGKIVTVVIIPHLLNHAVDFRAAHKSMIHGIGAEIQKGQQKPQLLAVGRISHSSIVHGTEFFQQKRKVRGGKIPSHGTFVEEADMIGGNREDVRVPVFPGQKPVMAHQRKNHIEAFDPESGTDSSG